MARTVSDARPDPVDPSGFPRTILLGSVPALA